MKNGTMYWLITCDAVKNNEIFKDKLKTCISKDTYSVKNYNENKQLKLCINNGIIRFVKQK